VAQHFFRVRIGDKEFEVRWSGKLDPATAERIERIQRQFEASIGLAPLTLQTRVTRHPAPASPVSHPRPARAGEHGGSRKASISKGVDDLLKTGWLNKKTQEEIVEKLHERFLGANSDNVLHVLKRRLNKTLVRARTERGDVWSPIGT
jgi:hypothetical protein